MRQSRTSGSVGDPGEQSPGSTRRGRDGLHDPIEGETGSQAALWGGALPERRLDALLEAHLGSTCSRRSAGTVRGLGSQRGSPALNNSRSTIVHAGVLSLAVLLSPPPPTRPGRG